MIGCDNWPSVSWNILIKIKNLFNIYSKSITISKFGLNTYVCIYICMHANKKNKLWFFHPISHNFPTVFWLTRTTLSRNGSCPWISCELSLNSYKLVHLYNTLPSVRPSVCLSVCLSVLQSARNSDRRTKAARHGCALGT